MSTYKIIKGQNIFDIAMYLYGSIEGIYDLLVSNSGLSVDSNLDDFTELNYHSDFVINGDMRDYLHNNNLTPVNGEHHIYPKKQDAPFLVFCVDPNSEYVQIGMSGEGVVGIDWGDNTDIEDIALSSDLKYIEHYFDNKSDYRQIRLSGDVSFRHLDISKIAGEVYMLKGVIINEIEMHSTNNNIDGLFLSKDTYSVDFSRSSISSLIPIGNMNLQKLDITDSKINASVLDEYLIYLAENYKTRRNCFVVTTESPTGVYEEPIRDKDGRYVISNGMQAIWVILHEPSWNESGEWAFDINGKIYL